MSATGAYGLDDRNDLARQCADLRDRLTALRDEYFEAQERASVLLAAMELDAGKSVDEVSESAYDDKDRVLDVVKDRCWSAGYLEGLKAARRGVEALIVAEKETA
jgi:hypothetical protein